ncbi:MAG: dihydrofolate reductase, partial [Bacteroidales bacterium]|nr:dihydrofolate reductase [Bacteroidales bacterium]
MRTKLKMLATIASVAAICSCGQKQPEAFRYTVDEFADLKIMRYQIPGWDELTFGQKQYIYYLSEAAKYGRDIIWEQNYQYNLPIRKALEKIIKTYNGDKQAKEWQDFMVYAKRVFFSNGIHHHYGEHKFFPDCPREFVESLFSTAGCDTGLVEIIYNPQIAPFRRYQGDGVDLVKASANHLYEGVSQKEAEDFYNAMEDPGDQQPISYGLNSRLVKNPDGSLQELRYTTGGLYGKALTKVVENLEAAAAVAENGVQKKYIAELVEYYRTGDLKTWDRYNISWVQDTLSAVDFINGFIEVYGDPLGFKGNFEAMVNVRDEDASQRTVTI